MASCKRISPSDEQVLSRIFNPNLPYSDVVEESPEEEDEADTSDEVKEAKMFEMEGVKAAESGSIDAALEYFNKAVQVAPSHGSAYNNRAQALRLKGDVEGALRDLDYAIELTGGKGKAACQAYTQRAIVRRLEGMDEGAIEDFKKAANLGSEFSKVMVVQLNPYAALCNQMLTEVIEKVRRGEQ